VNRLPWVPRGEQRGGKIFGQGGVVELFNMKPTTRVSRIKALGIPKP
jgi:hypothetical protein